MNIMTFRRCFLVFSLLCFLLLPSQLRPQGWYFSFLLTGAGNAADNTVQDLSAVGGDGFTAAANRLDGAGGMYFMLVRFDEEDQFQFGSTTGLDPEPGFDYQVRSVVRLAFDEVLVLLEVRPVGGGPAHLSLLQILYNETTPFPELLWQQDVPVDPTRDVTARNLLPTADGHYLIVGSVEEMPGTGAYDPLLIKVDAAGAPVWSRIYTGEDDERGQQAVAMPGGWMLLADRRLSEGEHRAVLLRTGADGSPEWSVNVSGDQSDRSFDLVRTHDGGLAVTGVHLSEEKRDVFVIKTDALGAVQWRRDYLMPDRGSVGHAILEDPQNDLVVAGLVTDSITAEQDALLLKLGPDGTPVWEKNIGRPDREEAAFALSATPEGGYLLGGYRTAATPDYLHGYLVKTDVNGIVRPGLIQGNVYADLNADCLPAAGEAGMRDWVVQAFQDSSSYFLATTDSLGNYRLEVDTGQYVVTLFPPSPYWAACANDVPLQVSYLDTLSVDFPVQALIDCPYLSVDVGLYYPQSCDEWTYVLHYCNKGTATAQDPFIEVTLDDSFTFLEANAPLLSVDGNLYTFALEDLPVDTCGDLLLEVAVDCEEFLPDEAVCVEAHIYPDSFCLSPDPLWSGALIELEARCEEGELRFEIQNTGSGDMDNALQYIVIEDAVLLMNGSYDLGSGEVREVVLPATGATYHLLAEQEPGAPVGSAPVLGVEGCGTGDFTTGILNQFPGDDGTPFEDAYCYPLQPFNGGGQMEAYPAGVGVEREIGVRTELNYTLRFPPAEDSLLRVVLVDTLSPLLDPSTLRFGAGSHPCEIAIEDSGVLIFTLRSIPAGEGGFVNFSVMPRSDLPPGTVIRNQAYLQRNFERPEPTNPVFHTVRDSWFELISVHTSEVVPAGSVRVYPNPVGEAFTVEAGAGAFGPVCFRLYDQRGSLVREERFSGDKLIVARADLPAGVYFFTLESNGRSLGAGQIVLR